MGLRVAQVNIRNWKSNKYLQQCELPNINCDILLLNETGVVYDNKVKLFGFKSLSKY